MEGALNQDELKQELLPETDQSSGILLAKQAQETQEQDSFLDVQEPSLMMLGEPGREPAPSETNLTQYLGFDDATSAFPSRLMVRELLFWPQETQPRGTTWRLRILL